MNKYTKKLIKYFEDLFNGQYDPYLFSIDFADYCFEHFNDLEKEHKGLGEFLDQSVPDICDKGEPNFDPTDMISELKQIYSEVCLKFI